MPTTRNNKTKYLSSALATEQPIQQHCIDQQEDSNGERMDVDTTGTVVPTPSTQSDDISDDLDMKNELNLEGDDDANPTVVLTQSTLSRTGLKSTLQMHCPLAMIPTCSKPTTATSTEQATASNGQSQTSSPSSRRRSCSQLDDLLKEMGQHRNNTNKTDNDDDELESELDDELKRTTEANRHIELPAETTRTHENNHRSIHHNNNHKRNHNGNNHSSDHGSNHDSMSTTSDHELRQLLVFSDASTHRVKKRSTHKAISMVYGAGFQGDQIRHSTTGEIMVSEEDSMENTRHYLIACDFSHESLHAMEWTMGTMLRDHDTLHIVTVTNREETTLEPDLVLEKEMDHILNDVIDEAKKRLSRMMLYDIKLVFYSMAGRVNGVLDQLIQTLPLTMVVCGSRGRGTMKGMLLGSVSSFLVHQSAVPVAVIRPQKKHKRETRHTITAMSLSESVKSGHLHVDELG